MFRCVSMRLNVSQYEDGVPAAEAPSGGQRGQSGGGTQPGIVSYC